MITNRSSEPRLLRKRGGSATEKLPTGPSSPLLAKGNKTGLKKPDNMTMTSMIKKISGSQTHRNLTTEPSLKALRAPKSQVTDALPKQGAGFGIKRRAAGGGMKTEGTAQESYVNHGARPDGKVNSVNPIQSAKGGKSIIKKPAGRIRKGYALGDSVQPQLSPRSRSTSPSSRSSSPLPDFSNMSRSTSPGSRSSSPSSRSPSPSPLPDFSNMTRDVTPTRRRP